MLTNLELYGTEDVPRINKEDCNKRILLLNVQLAKIYKDSNNSYLVTKVIEAKSFWSRMMLGEGDLK